MSCVEVTCSARQLVLVCYRGSAWWRVRIRLFCTAAYVLSHVTVTINVKCEVSLELYLMKVDMRYKLE